MLGRSEMPASAPLLSVIIVCRNPGPRLPAALASVWDQPPADCETIVVDGASTDGTGAWLDTHRGRLGRLISEPDGGIYDAMNKGLAVARGEWILFLGADDRLQDNVLSQIIPALQQATAEVVVGEIAYDDGRVYRLGAARTAVRRNFVHHQAAFYRRALFATHGQFRTTLRIMADYDFNLRLVWAGVRFQDSPFRVATCGSGGRSDRGDWFGYREEIAVRHAHFPAWRCWVWDLFAVLRYLRKRSVLRRAGA
jgi:glycosyltransferase involved in cell wall biosynthesis